MTFNEHWTKSALFPFFIVVVTAIVGVGAWSVVHWWHDKQAAAQSSPVISVDTYVDGVRMDHVSFRCERRPNGEHCFVTVEVSP